MRDKKHSIIFRPQIIEIYWHHQSPRAFEEIINHLTKKQWNLICHHHQRWVKHLLIAEQPTLDLLKEICYYRINILRNHNVNGNLLDKYKLIFNYLDQISSPIYLFSYEKIYSCLAHILYMGHIEVCKASREPGYLGSYVIYRISLILEMPIDLISFLFWITKSFMLCERENKFHWFDKDFQDIHLLVEDVDLHLLEEDSQTISLHQGECSTLYNLTLSQSLHRAFQDEWENIKIVKKYHIRLFLGLTYYMRDRLKGITMDKWLLDIHQIHDLQGLKNLTSDPLLVIIDHLQ